MKMLRLAMVVVLLVTIGKSAAAQGAYTLSRTDIVPVTAGNHSYRLSIALPAAHDAANGRFPVVYLLDGDWYFGLTVATLRLLEAVGECPPTIVVAIGYGGDVAEQRRRRIQEFTPVREERLAGSGQAAAFLERLRATIIPLIESRYRASTDRTLVGHSLGGLFATYASLHAPGLFKRVVIGSPALWSSTDALREELLKRRGAALPDRVFLAVASGDGPVVREGYDALHTWLKGTQPPLRWVAEEFPNLTHQSVVPALVARALPWILAEPQQPPSLR
jgi:hypothetical protein